MPKKYRCRLGRYDSRVFFRFTQFNRDTGAGAEGRAMCGPTVQRREAYRRAWRGRETLDGHGGHPDPRHGQTAGCVHSAADLRMLPTRLFVVPELPIYSSGEV